MNTVNSFSDVYNEMFKEYPDVVSTEQLKEMLQISRNSAYALVNTKKVVSVKIGKYYRIPKLSIIAYIINQNPIDYPEFSRWTSQQHFDILCVPTVD